MDISLLTIGAALVACTLAVAGTHAFSQGRAARQALEDRLANTGVFENLTGRRKRFTGVDRRLRRTALGKRIELRLAATGLDLTPGEFLVYVVAAVALLWFTASSVFAPFFGPIAGLLALWGGSNFLTWQRTRRTEKFIAQLPELSRVLANGTQAGLALRSALAMAAEEMEAPAGEELRRVTRQLDMGRSIDDALAELAERLPSRELVVLVSTLVLSNRAGGTVVGSLRNLTITLEERKETRREVRTQLSQVTMTAYAVPMLGVGTLLLLNAAMPGALDRLTGSFVGQTCVVVSFALYGLGFLIIRRMSKIKV
ncbi:type II secretion system F family protein [Streptomyces polyrhachis]|uniref:Type II secretion system F family protein n=1 Tax=Streptomyces polyrhachis TaxID=1282885 RepID=A0ABW2GCG3_9ACTN